MLDSGKMQSWGRTHPLSLWMVKRAMMLLFLWAIFYMAYNLVTVNEQHHVETEVFTHGPEPTENNENNGVKRRVVRPKPAEITKNRENIMPPCKYKFRNIYFDTIFTGQSNATRVLGLLNLDRAGLEMVKSQYSTGNVQEAMEALLAYYRKRTKKWTIVSHIYEPMKSMTIAENALRRVVGNFGGPVKPRIVDMGSRIEWNYNAFWESDKDAEWAWGLHRQPWWLTMAYAFQKTGNETFAKEWVSQFNSWILDNPRDPRYDYDWGLRFKMTEDGKKKYVKERKWPNYINTHLGWAWRRVDAGRRGLNFPELFHTFVHSQAFTTDTLAKMLNTIHEHGEFLANNPVRQFTKDNHGLFEAEGSANIGILFTEFKNSKIWRKNSIALLIEQLDIQVRPDGFQIENVFSYHAASIRIFTDTPLLADRNGLRSEFPASYWERIEHMAETMMLMSFPDGSSPQFGDQATAGSHAKSVSKKWGSFFKRNDLLFFAGAGGRTKNDAPSDTAFALQWTGLYSMRNHWLPDATLLVLRCGPSYNAHTHKDAGTFELFHMGKRMMPDSGCYTYTGMKERIPTDKDRAYFQSTRAHQTLTLDYKDAHIGALALGPYSTQFGYDDCGRLLWSPATPIDGLDEGVDILAIENHRTYRDPDLSHLRYVLYVDKRYYIIIDEAIGPATGAVRTHFHLLPCKPEVSTKTFTVSTNIDDSPNLQVRGIPSPGLSLSIEEGFVSFSIGKKDKRPTVDFKLDKKSADPVRFITVLHPYHKEKPDDFKVSISEAPGSSEFSVQITESGYKPVKIPIKIDRAKLKMTLPPRTRKAQESKDPDFVPFYENFLDERGGTPQLNVIPKEYWPNINIVGDESFMKDKRRSLVVVDSKKYLYCGIPKCGVSRWRRLSRRCEKVPEWADNNAHNPEINGLKYIASFEPAKAESVLNGAAWYSFVVVRNPFTRLLSGWLDKRDFPSFHLPQDFGEFVDWVVSQPDHKLNEHWAPQTSFCGMTEGVRFDLVAKLEDISEWGPALVHRLKIHKEVNTGWRGGFFPDPGDNVAHNHRSAEKLHKYYTPELMKKVAEKYKTDFTILGYSPDELG